MASARVMIVEDEGVIVLALEAILKKEGYVVACIASRGQEALEIAANAQPDIVLMDVRLPGELDGIDTAKEMRSRLKIPVIFLTAHADEDTVQRAAETMPYGFIVKPVQPKELAAAIEVGLHRHRLENKNRVPGV